MDHAAEAQRTDLMTLTRHVLNEQGRHPESRGDFTILLSHIVLGLRNSHITLDASAGMAERDGNRMWAMIVGGSGLVCGI